MIFCLFSVITLISAAVRAVTFTRFYCRHPTNQTKSKTGYKQLIGVCICVGLVRLDLVGKRKQTHTHDAVCASSFCLMFGCMRTNERTHNMSSRVTVLQCCQNISCKNRNIVNKIISQRNDKHSLPIICLRE